MIISASRRTDIPAFYADWFIRRIEEQSVLVRNPMNPHQVSHVSLIPEAVDGIVLWTKNPEPMLDRLGRLRAYAYYFQYTLNAYGGDAETNLPALTTRVETFRALADAVGKERVVWRYDPIMLSPTYTIDHHLHSFEQLARQLAGYTEKCVISLLDFYPKISGAVRALGIIPVSDEQRWRIAKSLSEIADAYGLSIDACAESADFSGFGIGQARCVDDRLLSRISGRAMQARKDKNQRPACNCAASVDIGAYDTCLHGCRYCYANRSDKAVAANRSDFDMASPLLCSRLSTGDKVTERVKYGSAKTKPYIAN